MGGEQALIGNFLPNRDAARSLPPPSFFFTKNRIDLAYPRLALLFPRIFRNLTGIPIPAFFKDVYNPRIRLIAILFVSYYRYSPVYIRTCTRKFNPL